MDLTINFMFLLFFGIIGFIADKIPNEAMDLNQYIDNLENHIGFLTNALPGVLIGNVADTFVSRFTEDL